MSILRAVQVKKSFGNYEALAGLDLDIAPGRCVGLLGPNGAGKSTFIGATYGIIRRTSGQLNVFGMDPERDARGIKQRLGVVPQDNALDEGLTVVENMRLYANFQGLRRQVADARIEELLEYMSLKAKVDAGIRTLSGGMKRRLTFVRALLGDPELIILDEPTTGLDPAVRHLLWEKVMHLRASGKTILLTTHYMHEAEVLCDEIVILNKGKIIGAGSPAQLIAREAAGFVALFAEGPEAEAKLRAAMSPEWVFFMQSNRCCVRAPTLEDLLGLQSRTGFHALQLRPGNLEDVFLKLTGEELGRDE